MLSRIHGGLGEIDTSLAVYRDYQKYIKKKDRTLLQGKLDEVATSIRAIKIFNIFMGQKQKSVLVNLDAKLKERFSFLEHFTSEFTKREIERHEDFFRSKGFDKDQLEAIVKKDDHNLVIAAAGSGKTKTLTARLAFIIKCGVKPEEILALAYTNSAKDEMIDRLRREYSIPDANIQTFHKLGRTKAKGASGFRNGIANREKQETFIKLCVTKLSVDHEFALAFLTFAIEWHAHQQEPEEFPQIEKYYEYLRNQKYTTLNGISVKSVAERDIANFLFMNQVKYEYEATTKWADEDGDRRQYQPDFHLPYYDIWIEHWAINREGNVPPWFSHNGIDPSIRYRSAMDWKREQFKKHHKRLIETYAYHYVERTLIPETRKLLVKNGVELKEMTMRQILDCIQNLIERKEPVYDLMLSFIDKAKNNGLSLDDVKTRLENGTWNLMQRSFALLMVRVWEEYESMLKDNDMIDFNDMINLALEVVRNQVASIDDNYKHILIDEFQDITNPQLEIIKCLMQKHKESTLFCVGDARQNIFSFAGSNIYNILHFDKRFPFPEVTNLSTNYRCPKNIVEASNQIANLNAMKIESQVQAASQEEYQITLVEMPDFSTRKYEDWEFEKACEVINRILIDRKKGETILVLSRFNYPLGRLKLEFPHHEDQGLRFLSVHKAKGTEADYVLILSCISGEMGFPSEIVNQRVLDIVKKNPEETDDKLEEERRLFYVALTRCKKRLYIFTSPKIKSRFISELSPFIFQNEKSVITKLTL